MGTGMTPEERDILIQTKTKLDYIIEHMTRLPPSPETIYRLERLEITADNLNVKVENLSKSFTERVAWVSGAFAVIGAFGVYLIKYVFDHISLLWGSK